VGAVPGTNATAQCTDDQGGDEPTFGGQKKRAAAQVTIVRRRRIEHRPVAVEEVGFALSKSGF
jgi:hypothetical protein